MSRLPLSETTLSSIMDGLKIQSLTDATIRQVVAVATAAERAASEPFLHLEVGNPGLPPNRVGVEAEHAALDRGVASIYPPIMGITPLKQAGERFIKAFIDIDIPAGCIVPTVGSMQGSFTLILLLSLRDPKRDTLLYLDPGFPPQHLQSKLAGLKSESFDIYEYRGDKLEAKLESILSKGNITGMLYSNPNNPAWTNLTEKELAVIGKLATKYDVIVLEDLAYMGMDFRRDCGHPGVAPYIPTVAKHTDNYILLISASKIFSYAGQRVALACFSPDLFERRVPSLEKFFGIAGIGNAYIFGIVYAVSSGVCHSAQCAMAAMLDAATKGEINFVEDCREYERRCNLAKKIFIKHGFRLVYEEDDGVPVSDGFFFTATYGDLDSERLQRALMRHGIASISLPGTGSSKDGLRICISRLSNDDVITMLESRLQAFESEQTTK